MARCLSIPCQVSQGIAQLDHPVARKAHTTIDLEPRQSAFLASNHARLTARHPSPFGQKPLRKGAFFLSFFVLSEFGCFFWLNDGQALFCDAGEMPR
jgi:hypothetical protein